MSAQAGDQHLVMMANQIAAFFATQPRGDAATAVADHLRSFWTPTMRARFITLKQEGVTGFSPLAGAAAEVLVQGTPAPVTVAKAPGDDAG